MKIGRGWFLSRRVGVAGGPTASRSAPAHYYQHAEHEYPVCAAESPWQRRSRVRWRGERHNGVVDLCEACMAALRGREIAWPKPDAPRRGHDG